jgi:hypothetical protein
MKCWYLASAVHGPVSKLWLFRVGNNGENINSSNSDQGKNYY